MKTIKMNIGLSRRDGGTNTLERTILALASCGFGVTSYRVVAGEWEGVREDTLACVCIHAGEHLKDYITVLAERHRRGFQDRRGIHQGRCRMRYQDLEDYLSFCALVALAILTYVILRA